MVSVIVTVYNFEKYISECLDSILASDYDNYEIVVVDDGSKDKSAIICDEYAKRYPKIRVFHIENHGVCYARNYAIEQSRGEFILPVDGDDKIAPSYIRKAYQELKSNSKLGIVYCEAEFFGAKKGRWDLDPFTIERELEGNIIFISSMFRREAWVICGGFKDNVKNGLEDYDFWLSVLESGCEVKRLPEVLFYYRIREQSRNKSYEQDIESQVITQLQLIRNHPVLFQKHIEVFLNQYGALLREHLELKKAKKKNPLLKLILK